MPFGLTPSFPSLNFLHVLFSSLSLVPFLTMQLYYLPLPLHLTFFPSAKSNAILGCYELDALCSHKECELSNPQRISLPYSYFHHLSCVMACPKESPVFCLVCRNCGFLQVMLWVHAVLRHHRWHQLQATYITITCSNWQHSKLQ